MKPYALVVDDEEQICRYVGEVLVADGWEVTEAFSAEQAFEMLPQRNWSAVFCDVMLGGSDGFSVLRRFKDELPEAKVVLMTGHGTATGALDATAFGAFDYLLKPFGVQELQTLSSTIREQIGPARPRITRHRGSRNRGASNLELVGCSEVFIEVMKQVGRVATTELSVLLSGESGTGKELVASALHQRSKRSAGPFVAVNCAAIPAELIESEMFGHVRGSFSGADRDRPGMWEVADGGTIFLDEITEATSALQVKLLRALQEREIRRVGSNSSQSIDVRVIAASNRNVEEEVKAGRFREDLFYRLNAVSITLPPLRDRREDILPLAHKFAEQIYSLNTRVTFAAETLKCLEQYPWPGNIRELENAVVRAAALCDGIIRPRDLPEKVRNYEKAEDTAAQDVQADDVETETEWYSLAEIERRYVMRVLKKTNGNKQAAAQVLGIDRKTLSRMIKRYETKATHVTVFPSRAA